MKSINDIKHLIKVDFIINKRSKITFGNTILYMLNTIIICYYTLKDANIRVWYILFWIILLFASINSTAININNNGTYRYLDILVKPIPLIISKLIYNTIIIATLGIIESILFVVLTNNIDNYFLLLAIVLLGSICLSSVLTFLTSIVDKTKSNLGLITILGCPMLLPTILSFIQITIELHENAINLNSFIPVLSLCILIVTCTILLFPYIWKE